MKRPYSSLALWSSLRWSQMANRHQVWIFALGRVPFEEGMGGFVVGQHLTLPSGDQPASVCAAGSTALKTISMSCSGKASLDTPIRLLAH